MLANRCRMRLSFADGRKTMTPKTVLCYYPPTVSFRRTRAFSAVYRMQQLFSPQYQWFWTLVLGVLLFFPVRQLIWAMSVRREERKLARPTDEDRRRALKRRATVTSVLLCFVFSVAYVHVMFRSFVASP